MSSYLAYQKNQPASEGLDLIRFSGFRCKPDGFCLAMNQADQLWGKDDVVTKDKITINVVFNGRNYHQEEITSDNGLTRKELLVHIVALYEEHLNEMNYHYFRNEYYISGVNYNVNTQNYYPVVETF